MTTLEFWIGMVFWCIGKDCGMIATRTAIQTEKQCIVMKNEMVREMKSKLSESDIIDGRCGRHTITFSHDNLEKI